MSATAPLCRGCAQQWSHCHSTWIEHAATAGECTDDHCQTPAEGHEHVVRCHEIGCSC